MYPSVETEVYIDISSLTFSNNHHGISGTNVMRKAVSVRRKNWRSLLSRMCDNLLQNLLYISWQKHITLLPKLNSKTLTFNGYVLILYFILFTKIPLYFREFFRKFKLHPVPGQVQKAVHS